MYFSLFDFMSACLSVCLSISILANCGGLRPDSYYAIVDMLCCSVQSLSSVHTMDCADAGHAGHVPFANVHYLPALSFCLL